MSKHQKFMLYFAYYVALSIAGGSVINLILAAAK